MRYPDVNAAPSAVNSKIYNNKVGLFLARILGLSNPGVSYHMRDEIFPTFNLNTNEIDHKRFEGYTLCTAAAARTSAAGNASQFTLTNGDEGYLMVIGHVIVSSSVAQIVRVFATSQPGGATDLPSNVNHRDTRNANEYPAASRNTIPGLVRFTGVDILPPAATVGDIAVINLAANTPFLIPVNYVATRTRNVPIVTENGIGIANSAVASDFAVSLAFSMKQVSPTELDNR